MSDDDGQNIVAGRIRQQMMVRKSPTLYQYFCVQHGGSPACEEANRQSGLRCPKCESVEESG